MSKMINKLIILGGDFNLFWDSILEAVEGSLVFKKSSFSKLIEIKEKYDLCDIWRIRNTKEKSKRRLDIFIVSNIL